MRNSIFDNDDFNSKIQNNDLKNIWGDSKLRIFISHLSEDKDYASKIKDKLSEIGISCFVAHEDIEPGLPWIEVLEKALFTTDVCLCLLSEKFHESNWTDHEVGFSYGLGKQIIPVNLGVLPYGFIQKIQAIKISGGLEGLNKKESFNYLIEKIINSLLYNEINSDKLKEAFVFKVENSCCFDESNTLASYFNYFDNFNNNHSKRLLKSFVYNDQVRKSNEFKKHLFNYLLIWNTELFPDSETIEKYHKKFLEKYKIEQLS